MCGWWGAAKGCDAEFVRVMLSDAGNGVNISKAQENNETHTCGKSPALRRLSELVKLADMITIDSGGSANLISTLMIRLHGLTSLRNHTKGRRLHPKRISGSLASP